MAATKRKKETNSTAAAEQLSEPTAATPIEQSEPNFFQRLLQLSPEDWQNGHAIYAYRCWPVIDRRDQEHFLCKLSEPFDADYLLRNFGSGKYYLQLNNRRGEKIASKTLSLHNPEFPPRVDPKEVVASDPRNKVYFDVWKPAPAAPPFAPAPAATAPNGFTEATTQLVLGMSRGRDELAAKLAELAAAAKEEPNRVLETVETIKAVKELMPPMPPQAAPQTENKTLDSIVQMMSKQNDTLMQLLMLCNNSIKQSRRNRPTRHR